MDEYFADLPIAENLRDRDLRLDIVDKPDITQGSPADSTNQSSYLLFGIQQLNTDIILLRMPPGLFQDKFPSLQAFI
jgi:hypothetical protein